MWSIPVTSHEDPEEGWNVGLPSLRWRSAQLGGTPVSSTNRPQFTPRKIPLFFCYRLTGPQGYWMRTEALGHMNILRGPYRKSNPETRILWRSAGYNRKIWTPVPSANRLPTRSHVTSIRTAVKTSPFTPLILTLSCKRWDALQMTNVLSRASCLLLYGT